MTHLWLCFVVFVKFIVNVLLRINILLRRRHNLKISLIFPEVACIRILCVKLCTNRECGSYFPRVVACRKLGGWKLNYIFCFMSYATIGLWSKKAYKEKGALR